MKSMIAGFLTAALLLALHVAPPPDALETYASPADKAFAQRHESESREKLEAELGLRVR
jgi:hypothetical protein